MFLEQHTIITKVVTALLLCLQLSVGSGSRIEDLAPCLFNILPKRRDDKSTVLEAITTSKGFTH